MDLEEEELQRLAGELMNILKEEIKNFLDKYYDRPYILDSRVKNLDKLKMKQALFSSEEGYQIKLSALPDIVGFRISVETEKNVEDLSELIKNRLLPNGIIDYFNKPKENGFKAFLFHFEDFGINTEIQIMTIRMMEWTNSTHEEHDYRKYGHK